MKVSKKQCEGEFSLDNYHFEKHCILFSNNQEIIRSNNVIDETEDKNTLDILIHTGIPSLQFTIKEYIERYAYPLKIRDLLDTFEGILKEIKGLMKAEKVAYQAAMDRLKNEEDKKKSAREYKEQLVQQTDKAKVATKKLKELKTKLDQIKLDEHSFIEIKSQNNFLKSPKFQEILKMDSFETKREAESNIKIIVDEVNCRTNKMIDSFQKAQAEQNKKLSDIIKEVNDTINKLDNNNLLNIFNFGSTPKLVLDT